MDYPLNWAHQQDRKAEALVNRRKFADAITCHHKALEFLQEAIKMTQVKQALVSLQLQMNNHCRQQRILKEKWKRCQIEQEKKKQEQAKILQERQNQEVVRSEISSKLEEKTTESVDGKKNTECSQSSSLVISAENFSVSSTSSSSDCAASRDEKSVVKDLEGQVSELQMQVLSLSQDLEDSNRENSRLRKALDNLRQFIRFKFGYELENEMFAANLIKSQSETDSESIFHNTDLNLPAENDKRIAYVQSDKDYKESDQAIKELDENTDGEEDIPLPPLETPHFTYESVVGQEETT